MVNRDEMKNYVITLLLLIIGHHLLLVMHPEIQGFYVIPTRIISVMKEAFRGSTILLTILTKHLKRSNYLNVFPVNDTAILCMHILLYDHLLIKCAV